MFLSKEDKNRFKIMSRKSCERYNTQTHQKDAIVISIKSSWDKIMPKIECNDKNRIKAILFLSFDDVEKEDCDDKEFCMTFEDGKKIANFINEWYDKVDRIIIHCDGGVSRSAGVCAGIMRVKLGDDYPVFGNTKKHPNMTCYLRTLKAFNYI